ncbi:MAG TPA: phosphate/phosphite/phosphonate ABC transporter substrate-binding protein [Polyangiaceae bacterium]|nr:phosphate/phosphite/phosphonate ABC transporter substrate-binding protein [Polyangiaceae bacterium]
MARLRVATRDFLVLGWAGAGATDVAKKKMSQLAALVSRLAGLDVTARAFDSYQELAKAVREREIDVAWLPPIPFLALAREGAAVPLASVRASSYASAIIVRADSPLERPASLLGTRAAWVDRHSASGFVLPRAKLSRLGIELTGAFVHESFVGSHEGVVRAVAAGEADFGATYSVAGPRGSSTGPWSRLANLEAQIRVLTTFGSIPPDVFAARADLDRAERKALVAGLKKVPAERASRWVFRDVLGSEEFFRPSELSLYEPLHDTVATAYHSGILDVQTTEPEAERTLEIVPRAMSELDEAELIEVIEPSNPGAYLRRLR